MLYKVLQPQIFTITSAVIAYKTNTVTRSAINNISITDSIDTLGYFLCRHYHDDSEPGAEYGVLAEVQQRQAGGGLQRRRLVRAERRVVLLQLVLLIVEVLEVILRFIQCTRITLF